MKQFYYSLASGSAGNCGLLVLENTKILIDMGISVRKLKASLEKIQQNIENIDAVLLTHEHIDHIKGLNTFIKKYAIPIYASNGTAKVLKEKYLQIDRNIIACPVGHCWQLKQVKIQTFLTSHDAAQSVGYLISSDEIRFGYVTDLGKVTDTVRDALMGCATVVLESNHNLEMLRLGPYPQYLQERVAGEKGHLSNTDCAQLAVELVQNGTKQIILAHLSEKNNTPDCARLEVEAALMAKKLTCMLEVATSEPMGPIPLQKEEYDLCCPSA